MGGLGWIAPSQVSIDYGLSELMNGKAIRNPPRGLVDSSTELHWTVPLEELHALLPTGSLDNSVQPTLSAVNTFTLSLPCHLPTLLNCCNNIPSFSRSGLLCI
jgi:hypothetical protein